ncbi:MAG TPA: STAUR_1299 family protein [Thermoanaerobaculia bacterium]|jgi:hypothetical protein|nr:STAUR_1299 family protein [Thermoanaerobaculia bacterium]
MNDFRDLLRDKAAETIAGAAYNDFRRRRAEQEEGGGDRALYYEVMVPVAGAWDDFRDATFPRFARWLSAQKVDTRTPRGVVVAAFLADRCHLLDGARFLEVLSEMEGLNASALHFRVLQWLR